MKISKEYLIQKYINEKLSAKEISIIFDKKSNDWIYKLLRRYNIPIRNKRDTSLLKLDLIGKRFGKLVVINRDETTEYKDRVSRWNCLCDCGKNKIIRARSLLDGGTKSCGCIWKKSKYEDISGQYFSHIKIGAKKRNLEFDLKIKDIWDLYVKQNKKCALSGVDILFDKVRGKTTASLDRIDSSKGYTINNVQWVHKDINQMKSDRSIEGFRWWCQKVVNHLL